MQKYLHKNIKELYPIKLIFTPSLFFYIIYCTDKYDQDWVVTYRMKVILFRSYRKMKLYLKNNFPQIKPARKCDKFCIFLCNKQIIQKKQTSATINVFILFFDIIKTLKMQSLYVVPIEELYKFADYATFHHDFRHFFDTHPNVTPQKLVAFVDWAAGVLIENSHIK